MHNTSKSNMLIALVVSANAALATAAWTSGNEPVPPDGTDLGDAFRRFVTLKQVEIRRVSSAFGVDKPSEVQTFIAAIESRKWRLAEKSYEEYRFVKARNMDIASGSLSAGLQDISGVVELMAKWASEPMDVYVQESLRDIPAGSVIFGGTDQGRFFNIYGSLLTRSGEVMVVTQNALADVTYSEYIRVAHSNRLTMYTTNEASATYARFVTDVKSGRRARSFLRSVKGQEQVSGVDAVMEINGMLAEIVFERNRSNHAFFVEESYVIPWMYAYLTPHGLIMKLNSAPLAVLPQESITADQAYWAKIESRLLSMPSFVTNVTARQAFAKSRCAIAGIYAFRKTDATAEQAFRQALRLDPTSIEGCFRLASFLRERGKIDQAVEVVKANIKACEQEKVTVAEQVFDLLRSLRAQNKGRDQ